MQEVETTPALCMPMLMQKTNMTETILPNETIVAPAYQHINQNDPKLLNDPYFGEALKQTDSGICWAASLAMCVSAHTQVPSSSLLSVIGRFAYEIFPKHFAEIQDDVRQVYGENTSLPFIQEGLLSMFSDNGGLNTHFLRNYPAQTEAFLKHIFNDSLGLGIGISIPPRLVGLHNSPEDLINELLQLQHSRTCVIGVNVERYSQGKQKTFNHMVYVSGIEKAGGQLHAIRVSDPDHDEAFWLSGENLGSFTVGYGVCTATSDETTYILRSNPTPLIWIESGHPVALA